MGRGCIFRRVVSEDLTEKLTFEGRLEGDKRAGHVDSLGRVSHMGHSMCKDPEAGTCLLCWQNYSEL